MTKTNLLTALLLMALPVAAGAAGTGLDAHEQRIVAQVDAHIEEAIGVLEEVVNLNSGTLNAAGVRAVGEAFRPHFEAIGFKVRWEDYPEEMARGGNFFAERLCEKDCRGRRLLLIGHLDTVFEPDSPFQRYERLSDGEATGPGITDMKGGNVVMLEALRALRAVGALDDSTFRVVLTGDEEKSGRPLSEAREALRRAATGADYAIGFEDGDGDPRTAVVSRRGSTSWKLRTTGTPAHSSQVFTEAVGAGAIYEAARILTAFYDELRDEPHLTFNPGVITGGTEVTLDSGQGRGSAFGKTNVVAEHAAVDGDLRALSPEQYERATAEMLEIAAANLPRTTATLTFSEGYPPLAPTDGNRELLERYSRVSRDLGLGPVEAVDPRDAGAADVAFVADLVPRVLDGVGLMGRHGHTVNEVADLTTLPSQTKRAAILLHRLAGE